MKLTDNRLRVLRAIAFKEGATVADLHGEAPMRCRFKCEWAGPHCRWLLKNGLTYVEAKDRFGAKIHVITDAGRKALEENA